MQLPRSYSDPAVDARRTRNPPINGPNTSYKGLPGAKLPDFHGHYIENAETWLETIEDRFYLSQTPDKYKVASITSQLKGTAGQWFSDLRKEYGRRPSWEEFKKELYKRFIDSATRSTYLRFALKSIAYSNPQDMEQYIATFRNIELQISRDSMSFGDRLEYFLGPFDTKLKRRIKNERHSTMESVYNATQEWAMDYIDTLPVERRTVGILGGPRPTPA